jgi:hypothetical protein
VRRCRYSGAEVLSLLFLRYPALVRRARVLEVGAGIGLTAIAAATAMGAEERTGEGEDTANDANVTGASQGLLCVTDGEEDAVRLARVNLHLHCTRLVEGEGWGATGADEGDSRRSPDCPPLPPPSSTVVTSPRVFPFDESPPSSSPTSGQPSPSLPSIEALRVQWSGEGHRVLSSHLSSLPCPVPLFSLVYGADVIYARKSSSSLLSFVLSFLAPGGHVLLCHTPRVPGLRAELRRSCEGSGLTLAYLPLLTFLTAEEVTSRGWIHVEVAVIARGEDWTEVEAAYGRRGLSLEGRGEGERREEEEDGEDELTVLRALAGAE